MKFEIVSEQNFLLYAAQNYDNPQCLDVIEFYEDLNRFKYLKRLFNKYLESGELKERLILNHLVILYNVFGVEPTNKMLFLKLKGHERVLKSFLIFLNTMPEKIKGIGFENKEIKSITIDIDAKIIEALKAL